MDTKITINKETGEVVTGDIIAAYKSASSNKTFYFFTFHEMDGNGNENVHVSECVDSKLNKVSSDSDWNEVKDVMRSIVKLSKGEAVQDQNYSFIIFQSSVTAGVESSKDILVPKDAISGMNKIYIDKIAPKEEEKKVDTGVESLATEVNIFDKGTSNDTNTNEPNEANGSSNNTMTDINPEAPINNTESVSTLADIEPVEIQESVVPENVVPEDYVSENAALENNSSENGLTESASNTNNADLLNKLIIIGEKRNELNEKQRKIDEERSELDKESNSILIDLCNYIKKNDEGIKDVNAKCDLNLKGIANVIQFQKQGGNNNQIIPDSEETGNTMETDKAKVLTLSNGISSGNSTQDSTTNSVLYQNSVLDNAA